MSVSESNMPLQNRVTPFGEIVAVSERGSFMGNRGRIHNEQRTLETRHWDLIEATRKRRMHFQRLTRRRPGLVALLGDSEVQLGELVPRLGAGEVVVE